MSNQQSPPKKEFNVRVPKADDKRKLFILKFNESLNVKPQEWVTNEIRMEREDNKRQGLSASGELAQDYGEGSEYGKAARDEARRKKYGRQSHRYEHDKQPWKLEIEQNVEKPVEEGGEGADEKKVPAKKVRKFRSMREAGAGEHADYWVFYKVGNELEAHKVDEWYQFLPAVTYKYLDAEQAEERFKERDKVFNQFALKAQIQKQLAEQEERQQKELRKGTTSLKIKDEMSSDDEDETGEQDESKASANKKTPKKKKPPPKSDKDRKKQRVENADEIAAYESDDGDDEGREYDYMSDSGSDSEREELNVEKKMDEDLVGVADESGLRDTLESDADEEAVGEEEKSDDNEDEEMAVVGEEAERGDTARPKAVKNVEKIMSQKSKLAVEFDENDTSGSDSDDDPDSGKMKSVLFMQDKRKRQGQKRPAEDQMPGTSTDQTAAGDEAKRPKLDKDAPQSASSSTGGTSSMVSEAFIRKLLEKKPHSTKQLIAKVSQKLQQEGQPENKKAVVAQLAEILKKIEPYQFRKKNEETGKEVLYLSMNRTA